jgi:hypothetical protein
MSFDLENYVDVRQRIQMFREKYPNGSLQPANPEKPYEILTVGDSTFIVYIACAYRSPEDTKPGIGSAMERIPGKTPYTKDSELMNAETSAWGRAIVASLAVEDSAPIASRQEVLNRREAPSDALATIKPIKKPTSVADAGHPASIAQKEFVRRMLQKLELADADCVALAGSEVDELSMTKAKGLLDGLLAVQKGQASFKFGPADGELTIEWLDR